jgi:hypothetical protein
MFLLDLLAKGIAQRYLSTHMQQAEVIANHESEPVRNIGQTKDKHKKEAETWRRSDYRRPKCLSCRCIIA